MTGKPRRLFADPNLLMLLVVVMFAVTGGSLVGPILPAIMDLEGATGRHVGLAISVAAGTAEVVASLAGLISSLFS